MRNKMKWSLLLLVFAAVTACGDQDEKSSGDDIKRNIYTEPNDRDENDSNAGSTEGNQAGKAHSDDPTDRDTVNSPHNH